MFREVEYTDASAHKYDANIRRLQTYIPAVLRTRPQHLLNVQETLNRDILLCGIFIKILFRLHNELCTNYTINMATIYFGQWYDHHDRKLKI